MRALAAINFTPHLAFCVVHQYLALTSLDENHEGRNRRCRRKIPNATRKCMAPVLTNSSVPPIALGSPAAMPAKIIRDIPLPIPRSVICSPSHIKNIVPVTNVITVVSRNMGPGSNHQSRLRLQCNGYTIALYQRQPQRPIASDIG